jgi:hypothetical protein
MSKLTKTMKTILLSADTSRSGSYQPGFRIEKRAIWAMQEQGLFGPLCWDGTYPITEKGRQVADALREEEKEKK